MYKLIIMCNSITFFFLFFGIYPHSFSDMIDKNTRLCIVAKLHSIHFDIFRYIFIYFQ